MWNIYHSCWPRKAEHLQEPDGWFTVLRLILIGHGKLTTVDSQDQIVTACPQNLDNVNNSNVHPSIQKKTGRRKSTLPLGNLQTIVKKCLWLHKNIISCMALLYCVENIILSCG